MCNRTRFARDSVTAQERMFRLAERDHGLSIKVLVLETGIPKTTLEGWKAGVTMPAWALFALGQAGIPDHLTSLLGAGYGKHVGTDRVGDDSEACFDELARETAAFTTDYLEAKSPDSPGGDRIVPIEAARLAERASRLASKARKAAA